MRRTIVMIFALIILINMYNDRVLALEANSVEPNKTFRIQFNKNISEKSFNSNNVYILDANGKKVNNHLELKGEVGIIHPPEFPYYFGDSYTLYISNNVTDLKGNKLKKSIEFPFTVRNMERENNIEESEKVPPEDVFTFIRRKYGDNKYDVEVNLHTFYQSHYKVSIGDKPLKYDYTISKFNGRREYGFHGTVTADSEEEIREKVNFEYIGGEDRNLLTGEYAALTNNFNIALEEGKETRGNTITNTSIYANINGETAESKNYLFHKVGYKFYRINKNTNKTSLILNSPLGENGNREQLYNLNFLNGWLYFSNVGPNPNKTYKMRSDGTDLSVIANFSMENMQIVDGLIYGVISNGEEESAIYKMDLEGNNLTKIIDLKDWLNKIVVYKGWIFVKDGDNFYAVRTNGQDKQYILNEKVYTFFLTEQGIYVVREGPYMGYGKEKLVPTLYRITYEGSEMKRIYDGLLLGGYNMSFKDGWLYFEDEDENFVKMEIDGDNASEPKTILTPEGYNGIYNGGQFDVSGDHLFFETNYKGMIFRNKVKTNGTNYKLIPYRD